MLKFLMKNALLDPASEARHIEHWPNAVVLSSNNTAKLASTSSARFRFAQVWINVLVPLLPEVAAVP